MNKNTSGPVWQFLLLLCSFHTMLWAAQVSPVSNGNWQDSSTWPGGQFPGTNDDVTIPVGISIGLSGTVAVKSITVNGVLQSLNSGPIDLKAEWILVGGSSALFQIGTESQPFDAEGGCVITLVGTNDNENHGMGDKYMGAMNGGRIELHGKEKISWTHLGANVNALAKQITLSEPVDWEVGDEIVIVSSRLNCNEAEKRTITAVSANGLTLTLNRNLSYPHVGAVETYTRGTDNKTWNADLRAEVGLLTHNVKVQGDASSESGGYGGHIMAMMNSTINASSIELYRMGQKAILGKYPWHWHLLHEFGKDQYFKNSSVHRSYNRAITIHGTSYATVENNFFYDHIGHGVFLEDGSERYNSIKNNVVLLSKRPKKGEELTPSDNEFNEVQNRTPSSYWITNPNNYFEGNVAAGTEGTGYWFAMPKAPMGDSAKDARFYGIQPYKEPLGLFKRNKAHSCMSGFDIFDQLSANHTILRNAGWQNSEQHLIEDCTWYANDLALYSGIGGGVGDLITYAANLIFHNNVLADNKINIMFASYSQVQESVIVANSGNNIYNGSTYAYRTYDGAGQVRDSHLVGWNRSRADYILDGGAATKHTNHRISGITTDDGLPPIVNLRNYDIPIAKNDFTPQSKSHVRVWSMVLYDEDGSFSGIPESSVVSNHPMMLVGDEYRHNNWVNAYRSPHKFALTLLKFDGVPRNQSPNVTCSRTKSGTPTAYYYDMYGYKDHIMTPVIVSENFLYTYTFETLPSRRNVSVALDDATPGDAVLLKFTDFGKLGGLTLLQSRKPLPVKNSLNELENSSETSYFMEANGDLYLKYVATNFLQDLDINWTSGFNLPMLDSDGDGVSDKDEIIAGTDPFPNNDAKVLGWDFDTSIEGWSGNRHNVNVSWNNKGYLDCAPTGGDPYVYNVNLNPFYSEYMDYLEVRLKNSTSYSQGSFYAFTQSSGIVVIPFDMTPNASEFETIQIDLSQVSGWSKNLSVNRLRIDPNNNGASGIISFDYIYFMQADADLSTSEQNLSEVKPIIYPNPVKKGQEVSIQLPATYKEQNIRLEVYDLQGRTVLIKQLVPSESIQIRTDALDKGLYMIRIQTGTSGELFKLLIE